MKDYNNLTPLISTKESNIRYYDDDGNWKTAKWINVSQNRHRLMALSIDTYLDLYGLYLSEVKRRCRVPSIIPSQSLLLLMHLFG